MLRATVTCSATGDELTSDVKILFFDIGRKGQNIRKSILKTDDERQVVAESVVIVFVASVRSQRTDSSELRFFFHEER